MFKKFFYLLFLILVIFAGFKTYSFVRGSYWDGQNRLTLLFRGKPSYLVSLVPSEKQVVWRSLETAVSPGVFVDLSYDISNLCFHQKDLIKNCLLSQFYSRLISWDNWRLWWFLRGVAPEKIIQIDKTGDYFRDEAMIKEGLSLTLINTTSRFGLANKMAELIVNSGGQVVRLSDDSTNLAVCQIKTEHRLAKSYTVKKLKDFLGCQVVFGNVENDRADVVIRLSEQNWADF